MFKKITPCSTEANIKLNISKTAVSILNQSDSIVKRKINIHCTIVTHSSHCNTHKQVM